MKHAFLSLHFQSVFVLRSELSLLQVAYSWFLVVVVYPFNYYVFWLQNLVYLKYLLVSMYLLPFCSLFPVLEFCFFLVILLYSLFWWLSVLLCLDYFLIIFCTSTIDFFFVITRGLIKPIYIIVCFMLIAS